MLFTIFTLALMRVKIAPPLVALLPTNVQLSMTTSASIGVYSAPPYAAELFSNVTFLKNRSLYSVCSIPPPDGPLSVRYSKVLDPDIHGVITRHQNLRLGLSADG